RDKRDFECRVARQGGAVFNAGSRGIQYDVSEAVNPQRLQLLVRKAGGSNQRRGWRRAADSTDRSAEEDALLVGAAAIRHAPGGHEVIAGRRQPFVVAQEEVRAE